MDLTWLIVGIVATAIAFYFGSEFLKKRDSSGDHAEQLNEQIRQQFMQNMKMMLDQFNTLSTRVDQRLKEGVEMTDRTHRNIGERLDNAAKAVNTVQSKLAELTEGTKRIFDIGKDIRGLQEILQAPKLRGSLGELFLGDLLSQIFPKENFSLQYKFKSGAVVDAVIQLRDQMKVPVDAKFPLENFKRILETEDDASRKKAQKVFFTDVKKHVDAIASKYILPDEGTFDFALMYIPAENVYYEVIVKDQDDQSISQYALSRRVIPVSPNSFYIYLQAILLGLRGLQIEQGAKGILATLGRLHNDFEKFGRDFELVGTHLGRASNSYSDSERHLARFQDKLTSLSDQTPTTPVKEIEQTRE